MCRGPYLAFAAPRGVGASSRPEPERVVYTRLRRYACGHAAQPHQAAAPAQAGVVGRPVRHPVPLLRDPAPAVLVGFERHGGSRNLETGAPALLRPALGSNHPIVQQGRTTCCLARRPSATMLAGSPLACSACAGYMPKAPVAPAGAIGALGAFGIGVDSVGEAGAADEAAEEAAALAADDPDLAHERGEVAAALAGPAATAPWHPGKPDPLRDGLLIAAGLPRDWGCEAGRGIFRPVFPVRQRQRGLDREAGEHRG